MLLGIRIAAEPQGRVSGRAARREPKGALDRARGGVVTRRLAPCAVLLIPLVIPGDWTQDVPERYGHRHAGMARSVLSPRIGQEVDAD